jgi:CubicO group peptidase (beta-lactamase class C family)
MSLPPADQPPAAQPPTAQTVRPNPDLLVGTDARPRWNSAPHRRHGFHNLHRLSRYVQSFRAGSVQDLRLSTDPTIAQRADVAHHCGNPWFSAMVVAEGGRILFERYAPDFAPDQPHSLMSISKTVMNLVTGALRDDGMLAMDQTAGVHLPWLGAGYHGASLQDIADMNVANAYDEDYLNPLAAVFQHEAATGMRLPEGTEIGGKAFLATIGLEPGTLSTTNTSGICMYRSANTDVLAAVAEAAGGRPMGSWLADLADAAGFEGALHAAGDRQGFAMMNGGLCLTARDLARYALLIARRGAGVPGAQAGAAQFGSAAFLEETRSRGLSMPAPRHDLRYSNQFNTSGRWLGHGGYGGQYMLADMETGRVGVFLSVLDTEDGYFSAYYPPIIAMLAEICAG